MAAPGATSVGLTLSQDPERQHLRDLVEAVERQRDVIAELDLEIETLRGELIAFEQRYKAALAPQHHTLQRIVQVIGHAERWREQLQQKAQKVGLLGRRLEKRRDKEIKRGQNERKAASVNAAPKAEGPRPQEGPPQPAALDRLKSAYRRLARRFHPDLARSEEERISFSTTMAKINQLYHLGDVERLVLMAEQASGGHIDEPDLSLPEQIAVLNERLKWFTAVAENLQDERRALLKSDTAQLFERFQRASGEGFDLIARLRADLDTRIGEAYGDVRIAMLGLEAQVSKYNGDGAATAALARQSSKKAELERVFDPYANKAMIRLGLEQIDTFNVSAKGRQLGRWLIDEGPQQPAVLRLILMTYVSEMSPFPLEGLESYADIAQRMAILSENDALALGLEEALVAADSFVEYGVRRATPTLAHAGLRFRLDAMREGVAVALQNLVVRRQFKDVLSVLGESMLCEGCGNTVFAVPLYRTRGLDNLRASVCPSCGKTARSYWMPKGQDVQAVLNSAFVDFELIVECTFMLAGVSIGMQLVPIEAETLTVKKLKQRFVDEVFGRHELGIEVEHVWLEQDDAPLSDRRTIIELDSTPIDVHLNHDAPLTAKEAVEIVRHRIRNRFKGN